MQHQINPTTTVTVCLSPEKTKAFLALLAKREEAKVAKLARDALQRTPHSEERDKGIAALELQIAVLKGEEDVCSQQFQKALKP